MKFSHKGGQDDGMAHEELAEEVAAGEDNGRLQEDAEEHGAGEATSLEVPASGNKPAEEKARAPSTVLNCECKRCQENKKIHSDTKENCGKPSTKGVTQWK